MNKNYESYKIWTTKGNVYRRETEKGAKALAEKLSAKGKHGFVEGVLIENETAEFETICKF